MNKFAVFDIDGTLIRWQLYHVIVDRLAKAGELSGDALRRLRSARQRWKNREHYESFADYEKILIEIFETSLTNINTKVFDAVVSSVIRQYKDQVYTFTRDFIRELKSKDYMILAISGSHRELVSEIARLYGFDDWVGSHYERQGGKFTGKADIASFNKAKILDELIKKHDLTSEQSYAIGDSKSDAPMLEMVENPIAFNPDLNLFEIAEKSHWPIVLERKNIVYRLEWKHDGYILAKAGQRTTLRRA